MKTSSLIYPDNKDFIFTIFDDTDVATLDSIRPIYDYLYSLRIFTTKSVWPLNTDQTKEIKAGNYVVIGHGELVHWFRHIIDSSKDRSSFMKETNRTNKFDETETTIVITPAGYNYASKTLLETLDSIGKKLVIGKKLFPSNNVEIDEIIMNNHIRYIITESARIQIANSNTVKSVMNKLGA